MEALEAVFLLAAILVAMVTGATELIKITFPNTPKNYIPFIAFVVGILLAIAAYPFSPLAIDHRIWAGAFAGLASTGLFELAFNPRPGVAKDK